MSHTLKVVTRRVLLTIAACTLLPLPAGAQSQWPSKPLKLIVPFAPGGRNDNIARVLAARLGTRLGQNVIIDNKGGAGGTIGTDFVAKSPADGYTLLFVSGSIATKLPVEKSFPMTR